VRPVTHDEHIELGNGTPGLKGSVERRIVRTARTFEIGKVGNGNAGRFGTAQTVGGLIKGKRTPEGIQINLQRRRVIDVLQPIGDQRLLAYPLRQISN